MVCATPPGATAGWYRAWRAAPPSGVVVDIASIKTPLLEPIAALRRAGARVASIHPMFGPATVALRDADVVLCETGDEAATAAVEALFRPTTARLVRLPLAEHDRVMADLLSLAHAAAIAFALALPEADHPVRSTTFQALAGLAAAAVRESPEVYYEIQADNPGSLAAVERLAAAVDRLLAAVRARRPEEFAALMAEGRRRTRADGRAPAGRTGDAARRGRTAGSELPVPARVDADAGEVDVDAGPGRGRRRGPARFTVAVTLR